MAVLAQGSNAGYVSKAGVRTSVQGLPLLKPPYGSIVAIDMNTGEHAWRIPNGDTPDNIKNHPGGNSSADEHGANDVHAQWQAVHRALGRG